MNRIIVSSDDKVVGDHYGTVYKEGGCSSARVTLARGLKKARIYKQNFTGRATLSLYYKAQSRRKCHEENWVENGKIGF